MTNDHGQKIDQLLDRIADLEKQSQIIQRSQQRDRVWDFLLKITVPIVLAAGAMVIKHEVELSSIRASRFTLQDAHQLELRMANLTVPAWLQNQLKEIKDILIRQDDRLRALEQKIR